MKKLLLTPILMLLWNNSWAQCPATVTITGTYTTIYTGSNSWITSTGTTTIPTGADVTLDANPTTDGYVLLETGFETQPNSTFLAVVQTPCTLLGTNQVEMQNSITMYPNPTNALLNIQAKSNINSIELFDIEGRMIFSKIINNEATSINMESYSNGMYLVRITTDDGVITKKVTKN